MNLLEEQIKALIITTLELEDLEPKDIISTEALFGEGLGLDSIDALELGLALQTNYGVEVGDDPELAKEYFASVSSLATFIQSNRP